jgi:hypothetical protein
MPNLDPIEVVGNKFDSDFKLGRNLSRVETKDPKKYDNIIDYMKTNMSCSIVRTNQHYIDIEANKSYEWTHMKCRGKDSLVFMET